MDLARWFDRVIATDASAAQIAHAAPAPRVEYRVARAESSGLDPASVDLVAVAQALHWLDHERFYEEVRRVTVPRGVIAAWSYGSCSAGDDIEPLLRDFEFGTLAPFWNAQRRWVDEHYRTIPFPFAEVTAPAFRMRMIWTLPQFGAYLSSWSAVANYRDANGQDPVSPLLEHIVNHWGPQGATREITWPLGVRVGRME